MPFARFTCALITLLTFWVVVLAGCAKVKAPLAEMPAPEAEGQALLAMWLERSESFQSLQGLAKVKVKTPQGSVSGTQVLIASRPDRLRVEVLSPFGTPLLAMASDGKQLTVLLPGDNLYYAGAATTENLTRFTGVPLSPAVLIDLLFWQPPLVAFQKLSAFRTTEGGWRVLLVAGASRQELVFDAATRLERVRYFSGDALQLAVDYAGFAETASLPRQLRLEQPPFALQASLDFSELAINQTQPAGRFQLAPPPGSRVVPLDQTGSAGGPVGPFGLLGEVK